MPDVAGYLRAKGLALKPAGARNIHTACVFCGEDPAARGRLYINIDPGAEILGLHYCHLCGTKGSLTTLKRHFGDQPAEEELDGQVRAEILRVAVEHYRAQLAQYPEVLDYLTGPQRGLTVPTIERHELGYAPMEISYDGATGVTTTRTSRMLYSHLRKQFDAGDILATGICQKRDDGEIVDALTGMIVIPYRTANTVVSLRGRTWPFTEDDFQAWNSETYKPFKAKYKTCAGTGTRLFNTDACWDTDEVYITEGEFDALILEQQGYRAVASPGAESWQETWDDYLTPLKRVWIVYDRDVAGEKGANKLIDRFGGKARRVHLSEEGEKCDPTMFFADHDRDDFEKVLDQVRKGEFLVTVDEAIDEFTRIQSEPGLQFGWELLDIMIAPGLQAGQVMVLLAKTNTGKSLMLFNLMQLIRMVPGQEDRKMLLLSLEQTRGEWWDRARRIHRFYNIHSDEAEARRWWMHNAMLVDRNRLSEAQFRQIIEDFAYQMGRVPDLMTVDYLGYWARSFRGEAYERTSQAIMALKAIAKEYRIPMIVPHQVSRVGRDGEEFSADAARDSVTGDTLITLADGRRLPIKDLVDTQPDVVAVGPDNRFTTRKAERVWCKGERDVFEVTTRSGRRLRCTAEHPLFTVEGWKALSDLTVDDQIAVPRDLPVAGTSPFPHAELTGALIADGGLTRSPLTFTKGNDDIRAHVANLAEEFGIGVVGKKGEPLTIVFSEGNRGGIPNPLTEYIRSIGCWGLTSPVRRVPDDLWSAPLVDVAAFLRGIWSCDGSITNRGLTYTSASEGLARDLLALLLRFGISSDLHQEAYQAGGYKQGTFWRLAVRSSRDVIQFAKWIGLIGAKGAALDQLALRSESTGTDRWDALPRAVWDHIHRVRRRRGLTWAETFGGTGVDERRGVARSRALRIAEVLNDDWLRNLATGHLRFEPVVDIRPAGRELVYDMTVRGLANFVANEILVKNSGVIEETADFLITMWNPDNSLGRSEEEKTGVVHMRIAKSRHGGRGQLLSMQSGPISLVMVPEGDPRCAMARREIDWKRQYRSTFEEAVFRHRTGIEGVLETNGNRPVSHLQEPF